MTKAENNMNILIIDDSEDDRMLYSRVLHKSANINYLITEAIDGEQGLRMINTEKPDCVLLDYSLPGRNGVEVLKRIRTAYPHLPVVMLTGQGNENVAVTAIQEGAQNYIAKATITPESLQRSIKVAVEYCSLQKRISDQRNSLEIFTRALAHDLKEPIRTISSFLELIKNQETDLTEKNKLYFSYIDKAAERMNRLIDTVHFYTRLDDPEMIMLKESCDISEVLEEVKENLSTLIKERGAVINTATLPVVHANRPQLIQLLQNLIVNSIRHSQKTPVIDITAEKQDSMWQVSVKDNGNGIEKQQESKVFQPFKRLSRGRDQGLGLGLAICKKICESHGGNIWYESNPETGTIFYFTLPEAQPDTAISQRSRNNSSADVGTILLVEDNEADIELTRIMLIEESKLKCNLLVARDAADALMQLKEDAEGKRQIDLLLLDINMPGLDGFEFLRKMHEQVKYRDIPVVMCTTSTFDKDIERAKSLGALGYMTKPAELSKLKPVIDTSNSVKIQPVGNGYALKRHA